MFNFFLSSENWPFFVWAFALATVCYSFVVFTTSHLTPDKNAHLSLWLQGDYKASWIELFCNKFDALFGRNFFSLRFLITSIIASLLSVFILWVLFDKVLGLISLRANSDLSAARVLVLGAAINIVPDCISMIQTRLLLRMFERVHNPLVQASALLVDVFISAVIIWGSISLFVYFFKGALPSLIEVIALFSIYSIFFFSTFFTSLWAWLFCLSSWISNASSKLQNWLDVKNSPGKILALVSAVIFLIASFIVKPFITLNEYGDTEFDSFLCTHFPASACIHTARLSKGETRKIMHLLQACEGGVASVCYQLGRESERQHLVGGDVHVHLNGEAGDLLAKACRLGELRGCGPAAFFKGIGAFSEPDIIESLLLLDNLRSSNDKVLQAESAFLYASLVRRSPSRTEASLVRACNNRLAGGCYHLGLYFKNGIAVKADPFKSHRAFQKACALGHVEACKKSTQKPTHNLN